MTKLIKNLALFLGIAFLLPLLMVLVLFESNNEGISFILYGIQAAAPTIAAVVVFMRNKELKQSLSHLIRKGHLITALTLPIVIICVIMLPAKGIASLFTEESGPFFGMISIQQGIIILWSIVAEEVTYNLFIHLVMINPSDNNGSTIPYVIMLFLEAIVSVILILLEERDKKSSHAT